MRRLSVAFAIGMLLTAGNVHAGCEKWKSEMASAVWNIGKYISAYTKYINQGMDRSSFRSKADESIENLENVQQRVNSVASCDSSDGKYEHRRSMLINTLTIVLPLMKAGEFVSDSLKDQLTD